jgi:citronellol/citronellal dehydrogenase
MLRALKRHTPLQRLGTEAEISAAVVFLLSPAAAFISGETLRVDGAAPNAKRHHELAPHDRSTAFQGFHRALPVKALEEE